MNEKWKTFLIIIAFVLLAGAAILFTQKSSETPKENLDQQAISEEEGSVAGTQSIKEQPEQPTPDQISQANYILFYGSTCPHCQKVEEWLKKNDPNNNLNLVQLEVYDNEENQKLMFEKFDQCELDQKNKGGVPFLYSKSKCSIGDTPIIDFLSGEIN